MADGVRGTVPPGPSCSVCGSAADPAIDGDPPALWSCEIGSVGGERVVQWVCPACTRRFARSIEAKLDPRWW